ncbi:hypothetical_protein [Leishmania braziliensis MHOM/BR/75/M2904]|uniref:Hypothetical_protein n=1 Tax=Leishmania braziliensis MHOM/BR/75/M2904 TaxID=420245 RepID=A0A3P3ZHN7_LEIBR|nr:hypothetical_protein [Leishmania braziliensis MHOM/BR/75/M2904]SYZ69796.1 hypothetical_protein [Leishmania braziliensis MHOM/BR/75/M2904]
MLNKLHLTALKYLLDGPRYNCSFDKITKGLMIDVAKDRRYDDPHASLPEPLLQWEHGRRCHPSAHRVPIFDLSGVARRNVDAGNHDHAA